MTVVVLLLLACTADKPAPADDSVAPDTDTTDTDPTTDTDTDTSPPDPDADDDGYDAPAYGGDDCDDTDPDVHPGAEEVPGNGVDDDCAGGDLPDADGDGHGDAAAGGDDCDDTSAWVYPGAVEYCDPVDQDCDGVAIAPGGCEGAQAPEAWATWIFDAGGGSYLEDRDGDGVDDLLVGVGWILDYGGADLAPAWALYAGVPAASPTTPTDHAAQVFTAIGSCGGIDAGDVTGDGVPDLVAVGWFSYVAWVQPGPLPLDGTLIDLSESDTTWLGEPLREDGWCVTPVLGGDFDADGINDLMCQNGGKTFTDGNIETFPGGAFGHSQTTTYADRVPELQLLPDLTGDGANELYAEASSYTAILDGADIAAGVDVSASFLVTLPEPSYYLNGIADRTGDGVPEFTWWTATSCVGDTVGSVYVFDGTTRGDLELSSALGCFVGTEEVGISVGRDIDLNGDDVPEYLLYAGLGQVVTPVTLPSWGEPVLQWGIFLDGIQTRPDLLAFANVDTVGTGDDLLFYLTKDVPSAWDTYLYPGWDIPWFDRTYWPNAE